MRFTDPSGAMFVYSGDTGYCDALVDLARGADVFLCEASWTHDPSERPPNLHLSGTEAGPGRRAGPACGELLLTHIPPWTSREDVISEAKAEFDGPVHAVVCGESFRRRPSHLSARGPSRLGLAGVQTRRRPARRRAATGNHHPRFHLPPGRLGAGGVRPDPRHVHGQRHRGRAALAQGFRAGLADRRVRDAARRHPRRARTASRSRAASAAAPRRSAGWSGGRCARASTWRRWGRTPSRSTATCCRPTAAPAPRRSPARMSRWPTR